MNQDTDFIVDEIYGDRLLISTRADQGDMHMSESILKTKKIVSGLFGRHEDFTDGSLDECYIVHHSKAVVVKADAFAAPDKESIKQLIADG